MKLSKDLIKRFGISKKAWSIQRSRRGKSSVKKIRRVKYMAKKKYKSHKKQTMLGSLNSPIMGAAGVVLYESFLSPMIPLNGTAKDLVELMGGLYLSKKGGFLGATGKSLVVLNSYQLISGLIGNKLQGLIGTTSASSEYVYQY